MTSVRDVFAIACPNCGRDTDLKIEISTWVDVTSEGTIDNGWVDHEWDDNSRCYCDACEFRSLVRGFAVLKGGVR